jgi:hypothetical protein
MIISPGSPSRKKSTIFRKHTAANSGGVIAMIAKNPFGGGTGGRGLLVFSSFGPFGHGLGGAKAAKVVQAAKITLTNYSFSV